MISVVFGPDLLVLILFIIVPIFCLGVSIFAIVDISSHSKTDVYVAGYSKTAWIVVIGVFTLFYGFGCLNAAYYLIVVRPKVVRIESSDQRSLAVSGMHDDTLLGFCSHCGVAVAGVGRYCSSCGGAISH